MVTTDVTESQTDPESEVQPVPTTEEPQAPVVEGDAAPEAPEAAAPESDPLAFLPDADDALIERILTSDKVSAKHKRPGKLDTTASLTGFPLQMLAELWALWFADLDKEPLPSELDE